MGEKEDMEVDKLASTLRAYGLTAGVADSERIAREILCRKSIKAGTGNPSNIGENLRENASNLPTVDELEDMSFKPTAELIDAERQQSDAREATLLELMNEDAEKVYRNIEGLDQQEINAVRDEATSRIRNITGGKSDSVSSTKQDAKPKAGD